MSAWISRLRLLALVPFAGACDGPLSSEQHARAVSEPRIRDQALENLYPGLHSQTRAKPFLGLPEDLDVAQAGWTLIDAFEHLSFDDPVFLIEAPGTGHLFVTEREGRVYAFENSPDVREKTLVLDLSAQNQGENDSGLLGLAFHPEFADPESPNRAYVYVHYAYRDEPIVGERPPAATLTWSRLSRFSVDLRTLRIDAGSELVLIDQRDRNLWHQGGALLFHPRDRFLYLAVGDEGATNCSLDNCQRIDRNLFSGVLRIDVDQRGGSVSQPISRQPQSGATAHYFIPSDNPFVGYPDALEEFYALGLRSPHRMTHDPVDDLVWIGDVGQDAREELNVLQKAGNYQWHVYEGSLLSREDDPAARLGVWTDPVLELPRAEARSVIGGYVYRGQRLSELRGKYIFGDYVYGNIWALTYEYDSQAVRVLDRELLLQSALRSTSGITSFGLDAAGELYVLHLGDESKIKRLERTGGGSNAPPLLSGIGAFGDTQQLKPDASLLPYQVQSELYSDGAHKQRWAALPNHAPVGFSTYGAWTFPAGTVFVKHFEMAMDERKPSQRRRLETRFLVARTPHDYYGISYKWNDAGSDAEPLIGSHVEDLEIVQLDGTTRRQSYFYPGPDDCLECHNSAAGHVLGVRTLQLNDSMLYTSTRRTANQLSTWSALGLLDVRLDSAEILATPRLARLQDATRSAEDRVRSYWDANCSMCHGVLSSIKASWDARYQTPLVEQGVLWGDTHAGSDADGVFIVVPGDPSRSLLYQRDVTTEPGFRMPPLGRSRTDQEYIDLLETWIRSL